MGNVCDVRERRRLKGESRVLTPEESRLIEKNHNLIFSFLSKYQLSVDDYYGSAALGLIDAIKAFDTNKGTSLSSFAFTCMRNRAFQQVRKEVQKMPGKDGRTIVLVSLDESINTNFEKNKEDGIHLMDALVDPRSSNFAEDIGSCMTVSSNLCYCYPNELEVLVLIMLGYNRIEIGKRYGVTRSAIVRRIERARDITISEGYKSPNIQRRARKLIKRLSDKEQFTSYISYLNKLGQLAGVGINFTDSEFFSLIRQGEIEITASLYDYLEEYLREIRSIKRLSREKIRIRGVCLDAEQTEPKQESASVEQVELGQEQEIESIEQEPVEPASAETEQEGIEQEPVEPESVKPEQEPESIEQALDDVEQEPESVEQPEQSVLMADAISIDRDMYELLPTSTLKKLRDSDLRAMYFDNEAFHLLRAGNVEKVFEYYGVQHILTAHSLLRWFRSNYEPMYGNDKLKEIIEKKGEDVRIGFMQTEACPICHREMRLIVRAAKHVDYLLLSVKDQKDGPDRFIRSYILERAVNRFKNIGVVLEYGLDIQPILFKTVGLRKEVEEVRSSRIPREVLDVVYLVGTGSGKFLTYHNILDSSGSGKLTVGVQAEVPQNIYRLVEDVYNGFSKEQGKS